MKDVVEVLRATRERLIDRITAEILRSVPGYAGVPAPELRASVAGLLDDFLAVLESDDESPIQDRLLAVSRRRVEQGFSIADFLRAVLIVLPVLRDLTRQAGPQDDPRVAGQFAAMERRILELVAHAANLYVEGTTRQLEAKNRELNRLNQALRAHERALVAEVSETSRALDRASEFNRRVIESLSAGVMVVATGSLEVTLYSSRLEQMLGVPAEAVLGRPITEALAGLSGLDLRAYVETVQSMGCLPLVRVRLGLPSGRARTVHVRAHRMFDGDGAPEGTVVVIDDITERELLMESLSRYVSRDVLERVLAHGAPLGLEAERRTCTILFADIRGFSRLAEELAPEALHAVLNAYFHVMIEAVAAHGGFIDKFVGDKVMALFLGPLRAEEAALAAVRAALAIRERLDELNAARQAAGGRAIEVGIGINTGEVLLGNVGSERRMDFTAIGDAVNLADRLQSRAAGGEILVGEPCAALVGPRVPLREAGEVELKGRTAPVRVFVA